MNRIKTVFAALICAFAITSCSNDKLNGEWKLVELLNTPVGECFNEPFLKIEDGRYNGNTGVNFINGEIETCPFKKCVEFEDGPCTGWLQTLSQWPSSALSLRLLMKWRSMCLTGILFI